MNAREIMLILFVTWYLRVMHMTIFLWGALLVTWVLFYLILTFKFLGLTGFIIYSLIVLALVAILIFVYVPRYGQTHMVVYIGICSFMGSLTVSSFLSIFLLTTVPCHPERTLPLSRKFILFFLILCRLWLWKRLQLLWSLHFQGRISSYTSRLGFSLFSWSFSVSCSWYIWTRYFYNEFFHLVRSQITLFLSLQIFFTVWRFWMQLVISHLWKMLLIHNLWLNHLNIFGIGS